MIAGWIIPGDHSVKDEELLLGSRHCKRLGGGEQKFGSRSHKNGDWLNHDNLSQETLGFNSGLKNDEYSYPTGSAHRGNWPLS